MDRVWTAWTLQMHVYKRVGRETCPSLKMYCEPPAGESVGHKVRSDAVHSLASDPAAAIGSTIHAYK